MPIRLLGEPNGGSGYFRTRRRLVGGLVGLALLCLAIGWLALQSGDPRWVFVVVVLACLGMGWAAWLVNRTMRRRQSAERQVERERKFIRTIFDATPDIVYVFDLLEKRYLYMNKSVGDTLGYTPEAVVGMGDRLVFETVHPEDLAQLSSTHRSLISSPDGTAAESEFRMKHVDGQWLWLRTREVVFERDTDGHPTQIVGVATDVTARKEAEAKLAELNKQLEALAATDSLTGIANRRALVARLEHEVQRSRRSGDPLSILLLDVDNFKTFNDTFGHPEGDVVLVRVAEILSEGVRDTDLLARYGGEEFAVVLPDSDSETAAAAAERLRAAIETAQWPKREITASFGVASLSEEMESGSLIAAADQALYMAKRLGRNRVEAQ